MADRVRSVVWTLVLVAALVATREVSAEDPGAADATSPAAASALSLTYFDKLEFDLDRALESAELDLASAERRFQAAQDRLDQASEPSETLREEVTARRQSLSAQQRIVALLKQRLERVEASRETWSRLARLRGEGVRPELVEEWRETADDRVAEWLRQAELKTERLAELRQELTFTRERMEQQPAGSPTARWIGLQLDALRELLAQYEDDLESLGESRRLSAELVTDLDERRRQLSWVERAQALWHRLGAIWSYPLSSAPEEPITVGKIVSALLVFLIGWIVAALLARLLGARLFPRLRLDEGAAHAFQSLAFYFFLLVAFLTALRTVNIPLTAFAVLGGALAIGVGFGSQNVVNNFISGLILLIERPIKIRDLIDVDGTYGVVERIGLRSTRILSGDNVHIIVPNASFLEGKVINWTHTDEKVRVSLTVGVAYGSPTREVARLIGQALDEHDRVLKEPPPIVLFTDFGDNALAFETRFWIRMRRIMDRLTIESEVRFRIDDLFREAGITIAFPQRDVHLDSLSPIEVKLVDDASSRSKAAGDPA